MRFLSTLAASILGTFIALGIILFFGFLLITAIVMTTDRTPTVRDNSVLIMELTGPIPERVTGDPFAQAFSTEPPYGLRDVKEALQKAAVDDRIEAVVLKSHGVMTGWGPLEEIRNEILTFKESGKPLYAYTGDHYTRERDYFLNSVADSVFADPEGLFEFNGFAMQMLFFQNMFERLGVGAEVIRIGDYKSATEPLTRENLSPENREQLEAILNRQNAIFMEAVAEHRAFSADELNELASEDPLFTARDAYERGLLDGLLYEDEVMDLIKQRIGMEEDDELHRVRLRSYVNVPARDVGLERGRDGEIAIIYAEGPIMPGRTDDSPFGDANIGSETFARAMKDARETDRTDAVVVRINSPGGSASASDAIWREIRLTAEEKPVIVSMGDMAASGGYWIATAADTIVADPLTLTGSIGVFSVVLDMSEFLDDKLGITTDQVRTSPYADMFSGIRPMDEGERAVLERFTDQTYTTFLERVAESRGMSTDEVDALGRGRVWTGQDAFENNLVDVLGGLDRAVEIAAERAGLEEDAYRLRLLPRHRTFFEQLTGPMEARVARAWLNLRTSPTERAVLERLTILRQLEQHQGTVQARMPMDIIID